MKDIQPLSDAEEDEGEDKDKMHGQMCEKDKQMDDIASPTAKRVSHRQQTSRPQSNKGRKTPSKVRIN